MSSASAPSPPASTPKFSIPASSAANWTNPSSAIFRPTPTLAAKTVSSTPSSSMAPFFILPSPFEREKLSTAMALSFVIYYRKWRKQQNEHRNIPKRKSALSHPACARPDRACRRLAHRSASVEFHAGRRDGALLRSRAQGPPPRVFLSPARPLPRRYFHRLSQINPHRLRQLPRQRRHWPLAARPPHRRPDHSRHAPRRRPVFHRHEFRCLAISVRLSAHRHRPSRLLHRRHSVLLEHSGGRRILCRIAVRQLRPCRAYGSRPARACTRFIALARLGASPTRRSNGPAKFNSRCFSCSRRGWLTPAGWRRRAHRRPPLSGASHAPQSASRSRLLEYRWRQAGILGDPRRMRTSRSS